MSKSPSAAINDLETIQAAWLAQRANPTTASVYHRVLRAFRRELRSKSLDLDSDPAMVAQAAQYWASQGERSSKTYRWRLDILSSFYRYGRRVGLLSAENPIERVPRDLVGDDDGRDPLAQAERQRRTVLGRTTLASKRDKLLLLVGQTSKRRAIELAGLRWSDVQIAGDTVTLTFKRRKGGEAQHDTLAPNVGRQFLDYLCKLYGEAFHDLPPDAPIWPSFARNQDQRQALSAQAIAKIFRTHLQRS